MEWISTAGEAYARAVPLSPFGLFMSKLLIQSNNIKREFFYNQSQLSEYFASFNTSPHLQLMQLNWENAMGAVFFTGDATRSHSIFLSQETFVDEEDVNEIFFKWDEPRCTVTTFAPTLSVDAWQEYYLRRSFADICNSTIKRFEIMTGRALVDSLVRLVAIFAARNNLDIVMISHRMVDHEIFSSPQEAAQSYSQILKQMFSHFSVVIGSRLLAVTLREIIAGLSPYERETINTFHLLPEGHLYE